MYHMIENAHDKSRGSSTRHTSRCFCCNMFKDIIDKAIKNDHHCLVINRCNWSLRKLCTSQCTSLPALWMPMSSPISRGVWKVYSSGKPENDYLCLIILISKIRKISKISKIFDLFLTYILYKLRGLSF